MTGVELVAAHTFHGRKGAVGNAFRYSVDFVMLEPEATPAGPALFSRNRANLACLRDRDHGGPPGQGRGAAWAREVLEGADVDAARLELLAQPRLLGHVFNPVSFWLAWDGQGALRAVIAEVTNTFGDRHSYLCRREDGAPITPEDRIVARKILHVSPFQPQEGGYTFRFDIRPDRVGIWIDYDRAEGGLIATLVGPRRPLTNAGVIRSALRRPFGARRVLALIHWQALKLWWKGARYRDRPAPPARAVTASQGGEDGHMLKEVT
ncbi:DUF1365 domain-containing protein [Pseudoponticoccus marisrubri]|uniref:Cyclopropane-fatty-acyl-phospholipid synthase n=1 Tax=Pseudoponticoccus marisrubri TaxID=1685382 RepID=A0A0W7WHJ5_9RHOB|nr:DUF1365 domain-containing protein [Pseudoponticoccus marisrubri]KUF10112.1 cyclopropane-fatty-acyl-phospholipid synthase [Pseudoponticoccus marisrubri]